MSASATLTSHRDELVALRASYLDQVEQLRAAVADLLDDSRIPDLVDDEGFGEGDTLESERARVLALASHAASRIEQVDAAIGRLDSGTYGFCEKCHQPIDPARLEAIPDATSCVACKNRSALRRS